MASDVCNAPSININDVFKYFLNIGNAPDARMKQIKCMSLYTFLKVLRTMSRSKGYLFMKLATLRS